MTQRKIIFIIALFSHAYVSSTVSAGEIHVAVASNFIAPMKTIVEKFEKQSHHHVKVSYGSSGKIYAQILHGAPYHVFFSADKDKPLALEKHNLTAPNSRFTYAYGTLALWSHTSNALKNTNGEVLLKNIMFNKLALANPKLAPYGAAAVDVLNNLGIYDDTKPKWVLGENIAQTYQFISTGNADIGFIALSQLALKNRSEHHSELGSFWLVPQALYNPIQQDAVLLKKGKNSEAAKALIRFVKNESTQNIIASYGYKTPRSIHLNTQHTK
ncbi:MAG: molybdate ABC transporter substrate-binding protein [Arenicella sp.]